MEHSYKIQLNGTEEQNNKLLTMAAEINLDMIPVQEICSQGKETFLIRPEYHIGGEDHTTVIDKLLPRYNVKLIGCEAPTGILDKNAVDSFTHGSTFFGEFFLDKYASSNTILCGLDDASLVERHMNLDGLMSCYTYAAWQIHMKRADQLGLVPWEIEGKVILKNREKRKFLRRLLRDPDFYEELSLVRDERLDYKKGFEGRGTIFDYEFGKNLEAMLSEISEVRSVKMIDNAYEAFARFGESTMILIFGDGHTTKICETIKERGGSYLLLQHNRLPEEAMTAFGAELLSGELALMEKRAKQAAAREKLVQALANITVAKALDYIP